MLTDKEKMELLNLRKRVAAQKAEIARLQKKLEEYKKIPPCMGVHDGKAKGV